MSKDYLNYLDSRDSQNSRENRSKLSHSITLDSYTITKIIFIIVLVIFLIFLFKDHLFTHSTKAIVKKAEFFDELIDRPTVMIGGNSILPEEILKLVDVRWPQVSVLSNFILKTTPLDSFYYSEKTDGEHKNLLIYKAKVYDVTHHDSIKFLCDISDLDLTDTLILDTELYDDSYYIFDVYYINSVLECNFLERLSKIEPFLPQLGSNFKLKKFKPIPSIEFLIGYLKNETSPDTGDEIDGVILQRIDLPYLPKKNGKQIQYTVYKMKPRSLMTVDFQLKYDKETEVFSLYTIGSNFDFLSSLTTKPKAVKTIYDKDGHIYDRSSLKQLPQSMLILFDSPFIPNLGTYKVSREWNTSGYFKRIVDHADHLISEFEKYPMSYHDKIVEMSLTLDNKWIPIRVRDDKKTPNGFKIAQEVVSLIFDPIKPMNEMYFQQDIQASSKVQDYVHQLNGIFRKYVVEHCINGVMKGRYSTVIDLCGGRGGDQMNLYVNGATNFFAIDADTTALKQYVDRSYFLRNKAQWYQPISIRKPRIDKQSFTVNVLNHTLSNDYRDILKDLRSRYEWKGLCNAVLMNYAIHYICDKPTNVTALGRFIAEVLDSKGVFVFTYFDGDKIMEEAKKSKNGKVAKIGPFEIEIVKNTSTSTIARMPLVTIQGGEDMYREEPLVHESMLKKLETSLKLVEEFNMYEQTKKWADMVGMTGMVGTEDKKDKKNGWNENKKNGKDKNNEINENKSQSKTKRLGFTELNENDSNNSDKSDKDKRTDDDKQDRQDDLKEYLEYYKLIMVRVYAKK